MIMTAALFCNCPLNSLYVASTTNACVCAPNYISIQTSPLICSTRCPLFSEAVSGACVC